MLCANSIEPHLAVSTSACSVFFFFGGGRGGGGRGGGCARMISGRICMSPLNFQFKVQGA